VFGVNETIKALESGAVEELIVWEDLPVNRYVLRNKETGGKHTRFGIPVCLVVNLLGFSLSRSREGGLPE